MTSATASYELLLFLVNALQANVETITAQVIRDSEALASEKEMANAWNQLTAENQDEIAADVHHVLSGISHDLAFLF